LQTENQEVTRKNQSDLFKRHPARFAPLALKFQSLCDRISPQLVRIHGAAFYSLRLD
jgi:hypothetical protein